MTSLYTASSLQVSDGQHRTDIPIGLMGNVEREAPKIVDDERSK